MTNLEYVSPEYQERLEELTDVYSSFLSGDIMPHHRDKAERFLQHLSFELAYRNGDFANDAV